MVLKFYINRMTVEGVKGEWKKTSGEEIFSPKTATKGEPAFFPLLFSLTSDSCLDTLFQQLASAPLSTVGSDAPARRTNTGSVYAACRPTPTSDSDRLLTPKMQI
jgi:hypothetical protein